MKTPFTLTPNAVSHLKKLIQNLKLNEEHCVRIGVKGGKGCMGTQHLIAFDYKTDKDTLYEYEDLKIVVDKMHSMHIVGMVIDYFEDETSKGFVFESPNSQ